MAQSEHIIEYPGIYGGTYHGEVSGTGPSALRHGQGVMAWQDGMRYAGEWVKVRVPSVCAFFCVSASVPRACRSCMNAEECYFEGHATEYVIIMC